MYKPFTFMLDNTRYITLLGLERTDVIQKSDVSKYKNAMPFSVFMTSAIKPRPAMEKQAGISFNSAPIVTVESSKEEDGNWIVDGTLQGKKFHLDATSITVGDEVVYGDAKEESVPAEEPASVLEEPVVKEEPAQAPAPEPAPAPVKEETVKEEPVKEEPVLAKEEPKPAPMPEKAAPIPEKPAPVASKPDDAPFVYGITFGSGTTKEQPTLLGNNGPSASLEIGVEFTSGSRYTPPHQRRREFMGETRTAQPKARYPWQRVEDIDEREKAKPAEPFVPSGVPAVAPDIVEKDTTDAWQKNTPLDSKEQLQKLNEMAPVSTDTPADITPAEPVTVFHDASKEVKEAFRSTLTPEINKVIGDIPHSILGPIEAFTTGDIDLSMLEQQGEVYCIDHRWQKCGKWYCIDIVERYARYFYNPKLSVSIEIPTAICKEWLNIVSGAAQ